MAKAAKLKELDLASKAHRLTSEVVTLITANRSVTLADAVKEWEDWMKVGVRSEKTASNNSYNVRQWMNETCLDTKPVGTVTTADIHNWVNGRDGVKHGTRMLRLAALRNFFKFCCIKRYVLTDPSQLVAVDHRLLTHEQKEVKHKAVFDDEEIEFILAKCIGIEEYASAATALKLGQINQREYKDQLDELWSEAYEPPSLTPGFFKAAIILGRDLGLRLGDICNLEWDCFNLLRKTVTVWQSKTGERAEIPITPRVIKLLTSLPHTDRYLFPTEREICNVPKDKAKLSMAFIRLFQRLGFSGRSFHSLRSSFATSMANQGMSMSEIAEALGQKATTATSAYVRRKDSAIVNKR